MIWCDVNLFGLVCSVRPSACPSVRPSVNTLTMTVHPEIQRCSVRTDRWTIKVHLEMGSRVRTMTVYLQKHVKTAILPFRTSARACPQGPASRPVVSSPNSIGGLSQRDGQLHLPQAACRQGRAWTPAGRPTRESLDTCRQTDKGELGHLPADRRGRAWTSAGRPARECSETSAGRPPARTQPPSGVEKTVVWSTVGEL